MATAKPKVTASASTTQSSSGSPQKWWQWFLIYPALGISLLTAAPQWVDKIQTWRYDLKQKTYQEAMRENELWRANLSCVGAPYAWYTNPKEVKVDATICNSGDVYVRASAPGGKEVIRWMALDDLVGQKASTIQIIPSAQAQAISALSGEARSEDDRPRITASGELADTSASQVQNVVVICQRFLDQRRLLRHVRSNNACFDEVYDTFNGSLVKRTPVPCRPGC